LTQQSAQAYWSISSKVPVKKKNGKMEKWKNGKRKRKRRAKREREKEKIPIIMIPILFLKKEEKRKGEKCRYHNIIPNAIGTPTS